MGIIRWSDKARWFLGRCTNTVTQETTGNDQSAEPACDLCVQPSRYLINCNQYCAKVEYPGFVRIQADFSETTEEGTGELTALESSSPERIEFITGNYTENRDTYRTHRWVTFNQIRGFDLVSEDGACVWYGGLSYAGLFINTSPVFQTQPYPTFPPARTTWDNHITGMLVDGDLRFEENLATQTNVSIGSSNSLLESAYSPSTADVCVNCHPRYAEQASKDACTVGYYTTPTTIPVQSPIRRQWTCGYYYYGTYWKFTLGTAVSPAILELYRKPMSYTHLSQVSGNYTEVEYPDPAVENNTYTLSMAAGQFEVPLDGMSGTHLYARWEGGATDPEKCNFPIDLVKTYDASLALPDTAKRIMILNLPNEITVTSPVA